VGTGPSGGAGRKTAAARPQPQNAPALRSCMHEAVSAKTEDIRRCSRFLIVLPSGTMATRFRGARARRIDDASSPMPEVILAQPEVRGASRSSKVAKTLGGVSKTHIQCLSQTWPSLFRDRLQSVDELKGKGAAGPQSDIGLRVSAWKGAGGRTPAEVGRR